MAVEAAARDRGRTRSNGGNVMGAEVKSVWGWDWERAQSMPLELTDRPGIKVDGKIFWQVELRDGNDVLKQRFMEVPLREAVYLIKVLVERLAHLPGQSEDRIVELAKLGLRYESALAEAER